MYWVKLDLIKLLKKLIDAIFFIKLSSSYKDMTAGIILHGFLTISRVFLVLRWTQMSTLNELAI